MKGTLSRACALGFVFSSMLTLAGCATTAPREELSIVDAMSEGSLRKPQSCAAMNAATVCVQSMRLNRDKDCGCYDRREFIDGHSQSF